MFKTNLVKADNLDTLKVILNRVDCLIRANDNLDNNARLMSKHLGSFLKSAYSDFQSFSERFEVTCYFSGSRVQESLNIRLIFKDKRGLHFGKYDFKV